MLRQRDHVGKMFKRALVPTLVQTQMIERDTQPRVTHDDLAHARHVLLQHQYHQWQIQFLRLLPEPAHAIAQQHFARTDAMKRLAHAANADTIKVGVTISTTGPAASLGVPQRNTIPLLPTTIAGQTVTYSIVGGADAAKFTINSSTGQLSFIAAPDYESPADAGGNNVYDVQVAVSDGMHFESLALHNPLLTMFKDKGQVNSQEGIYEENTL